MFRKFFGALIIVGIACLSGITAGILFWIVSDQMNDGTEVSWEAIAVVLLICLAGLAVSFFLLWTMMHSSKEKKTISELRGDEIKQVIPLGEVDELDEVADETCNRNNIRL